MPTKTILLHAGIALGVVLAYEQYKAKGLPAKASLRTSQ